MQKKIDFVTLAPEVSIKNWSGTEYYIHNALSDNFDVENVCDINTNLFTLATVRKLLSIRKKYSVSRSAEVGRDYARQIKAKLRKDTDIIFSASSVPIAYLETNIPKVFYTDATWSLMVDYYDVAKNLSSKTIQEGFEMEKRAIESSSLVFYSSEWAANSAINDYGADSSKIKVLPFGANIDNYPSYEVVKRQIQQRDRSICNVIFLGVDWERKRGDLVYEAVRILNEEFNLPTLLHIVGIPDLPLKNAPDYIKNHGFISKSTPEGLRKIEDLIAQSHFLFVPSEKEAYGIVFCESMSFGVPPVTTNTGGISTIVKHKNNGIILELKDEARNYAKEMYEVFIDEKSYIDLSLSAYDDFVGRLNWNVVSKKMEQYLNEI